MSAKEMFEDLGFKFYDDHDCLIYAKYFGDRIDTKILFEIKDKTLSFSGIRRNWWIVNLDLLKAIHHQLKELGWLDD